MPERSAALYEVAEAVEHVGVSVDQLIGELRAARAQTHDELTGIRRLNLLVLFGLAVLLVIGIVSAYTLYLANDTISPGGNRFKQNQTRTAAVITTLAVDADCRNRRAAAGLPAPDPRATCPSQTPAEVFPGVRPPAPGAPSD